MIVCNVQIYKFCIYIVGLIIQLQFSGVYNCNQYVASEASLKVADITSAIELGVTDLCNCSLDSVFLSDAILKCFDESPQHVVFRAVLSSVTEQSASELVGLFEKWVISTESVVIQNVHLELDVNCTRVIAGFTDEQCSKVPQETVSSDTQLLTPVIAGVVVTMIVMVIVVLVIIVVVIVTKKRQTVTIPPSHENSNKR